MGEQVAAGLYGGIAQLGEHLPCKQGVKGSNPFISTGCHNRQLHKTSLHVSAGDKGVSRRKISESRPQVCDCSLKTAY